MLLLCVAAAHRSLPRFNRLCIHKANISVLYIILMSLYGDGGGVYVCMRAVANVFSLRARVSSACRPRGW